MAASVLSNFFIPRETLRYTPYDPSQFWRQVGNSNALGSLPNLLFLLGSTGMYAPRQTDKKPHIVFMMADDLGWNDVSFHVSNQVPTPNIDAIARDGIILNQYYVQPTCSPSRGCLMTGKYPIRLGLQHNVISATEPWGLSPKEKILPQYLKELQYSTHAVGKWHLGFFREDYLPLKRGFDSFFGYYSGVEDHFTHQARSDGAEGLDLHDNDQDAWQYNGTYGTDLYTEKATKIIQEHDPSQPLFLYFAQQAVHSGNFDSTTLQAPEKYVEPMIGIHDNDRKIFAGMVSALDHSVGKIFDALETSGMLDDTIFIFTTDNGGATQKVDGTSSSNWPLKGGKYTLWEGGVRGVAFVWSSLLRRQSRIHNDLMHISDWLPTLLSASGGPRALDLLPQDMDGVDQWPSLAHGLPSPRSEILLNIDDVEGTGAFRKGRFKLVNGTAPCDCNKWYDQHGKEYKATSLSSWRNPIQEEMYESNYLRFLGHSKAAQVLLNKYGKSLLSATSCTTPSCHEQLEIRCQIPPTVESCEIEPCLYDIEADPCEFYDIARQYPQAVSEMEKRIDYYRSFAVPPVYKPPDDSSDPKLHGGVWGPWR